MAIKTPSILPDLQTFVANLSSSVPYDKLLSTAAEAGWQYRLLQRDVAPTIDDGVMVTFDVQVGRSDTGTYEPFDAVTIRLPPSSGRVAPISLVARIQLQPTLIYLFFGRLPPLPEGAAAPAQRTVDVSKTDGDIVLPDDDGGEYVPPPVAENDELDLVARREPDGVPIFRDLYAMGGDSGEIIDALLEEVGAFLKSATAPEQVLAVYTKNDEAMQFLKDLGDDQDRADLKALLDQHKNRLMAAPPATVNIPRRRSRAH